jgi:hypothetical protein
MSVPSSRELYEVMDRLLYATTGGVARVVSHLKWCGLLPFHDIAERDYGKYFHPRHHPPRISQTSGPVSLHDQTNNSFYFRYRVQTMKELKIYRDLESRFNAAGVTLGPEGLVTVDTKASVMSRYCLVPMVPTELFLDLRAFALSPLFQNRRVIRKMCEATNNGSARMQGGKPHPSVWRDELVKLARQRHEITQPSTPLEALRVELDEVDDALAKARVEVSTTISARTESLVTSSTRWRAIGSAFPVMAFSRRQHTLDRKALPCANFTVAGMYPNEEYGPEGVPIPAWMADGTIDHLRRNNSLPQHINRIDPAFKAFANTVIRDGGPSCANLFRAPGGAAGYRPRTVREVWDTAGMFMDSTLVSSSTPNREDIAIGYPYPGTRAELDYLSPEDGPDGVSSRLPPIALPQALTQFNFHQPSSSKKAGGKRGWGATGAGKSSKVMSHWRESMGRIRWARPDPAQIRDFSVRLCSACSMADPVARSRLLAELAEFGSENLGDGFNRSFLKDPAVFTFETHQSVEVPVHLSDDATNSGDSAAAVWLRFVTRVEWNVKRISGEHTFSPRACDVHTAYNFQSGQRESAKVMVQRHAAAFTDLLSTYQRFRPAMAQAVHNQAEHRHKVSLWSEKGSFKANPGYRSSTRKIRVHQEVDAQPDGTAYRPPWHQHRPQLGFATLSSSRSRVTADVNTFSWDDIHLSDQVLNADMFLRSMATQSPLETRWLGGRGEDAVWDNDKPTHVPSMITTAGSPVLQRRRHTFNEALHVNGAMTRSQLFLLQQTVGVRSTSQNLQQALENGSALGVAQVPKDFFERVDTCLVRIPQNMVEEPTNVVLVRSSLVSWPTRVRGQHSLLKPYPPTVVLLGLLPDAASAQALWRWLLLQNSALEAYPTHWPLVIDNSIVVLPPDAVFQLLAPHKLTPRTNPAVVGWDTSRPTTAPVPRLHLHDLVPNASTRLWDSTAQLSDGREVQLHWSGTLHAGDDRGVPVGEPIFRRGKLAGFVGAGPRLIEWSHVYRQPLKVLEPIRAFS